MALMAPPEKVRFHYIKSNYFRVVHVDGAHGGVTPDGNIFFSAYSQRAPIPQITTHKVDAEGSVAEEIREERITKDGIVREVEVGIMMDIATAESLHKWLGEKIEASKELRKKASKEKP